MNPLTTFVRSLGNEGAVANAHTVLDARRHEDWLVQGLARRLASTGHTLPVADRKVDTTTTSAA